MTLGGSIVTAVAAAVTAASLAATGLAGFAPSPAVRDVSPSASGTDGWLWPLVPEPSVQRHFAPPDRQWLPGHRGVDLAAVVGQVVRAPAAGEVTFAGPLAGRGVVVVTHRGGLRSTLEPVAAAPPVGTTVGSGAPVGVVTDEVGHCTPETCLHWGVLRGRTYLDPLSFIGRRPIILLPLH